MDENRLFVGNIPFNCTADEFKSFFRDMDGFVDAELIMNNETGQSKGFGFVTFINVSQAIDLMMTGNIIIDNRRLRFSRYSSRDNYKIFIGNIDPQMTEEKLMIMLRTFGEVAWCTINTKTKYVTALAVFKSADGYHNAINSSAMGNIRLGIRPYRDEKHYFTKKSDPAITYREGFKAGYLNGFEQGFKNAFENVRI